VKSGGTWRTVLIVSSAAAALVAVSLSVGLGTPAIAPISEFELGLDELRRLAAAPIDELPERIGVLEVTHTSKLLATAIGGATLERFEMPWTSFQIVYPESSIVVDVPPPEDDDRGARAAQLEAALRSASVVLFTHEHRDHVGGLSSLSGDLDVADRLRLNEAQSRAAAPSASASGLLPSSSAARIAPGVAVRPAPGHTTGSQLVYVSTRGGREYLLVGDVAWHRIHFEEPRAHPRISSWFLGEDSVAIGHQLRAIHEVWSSEGIVVVPSHDGAYLRELVAQGLLADGGGRGRRHAPGAPR
jgi:glyoxylase-like metal-dependent hydrolase (beta-lactamase superfamily II)